MSIGALIYLKSKQPDPLYVPVATEAYFQTHWRPVAERIGLQSVLNFKQGVVIKPEEWPGLQAELLQAAAAFEENPDTKDAVIRIQQLFSAVHAAHLTNIAEIYIG